MVPGATGDYHEATLYRLVLAIQPNLDFFQGEVGQALEQVSQGGCDVSVIGGVQDSSRAGPGQPALTGPAEGWTRRLQGPFTPQPFCGFMIRHPLEDTMHFLTNLLAPGREAVA